MVYPEELTNEIIIVVIIFDMNSPLIVLLTVLRFSKTTVLNRPMFPGDMKMIGACSRFEVTIRTEQFITN